MYSAYNLNNQDDNIQPWHTPFPICNQSIISCAVLTIVSWSTHRFLRRQVGWSGIRIFQFHSFHPIYCCDPHGQRLWCSQWSRSRCFPTAHPPPTLLSPPEFSCFFYDPTDIGSLPLVPLPFLNPVCTSGISQFTYCWSLKDFEHYFASMWNEHHCAIVWTFFDLAFLWDWNENWPFPVLWPLLSFPNLLAYRVQ